MSSSSSEYEPTLTVSVPPLNWDVSYFVLQCLERKKWLYRGEGNANIVIAVPEDLKVLRLRKGERRNLKSMDVLLQYLYTTQVIEPMVCGFAQKPVVGYIGLEDLYTLEAALKIYRPDHRKKKNISSCYLLMFPDYALLPPHISQVRLHEKPVFCVELKPKQGWIHPDDRLAGKCNFCTHQYLKVLNGAVKERSKYCPLDLYSGNYSRMREAIRNLLQTPQNNLKVFKNGTLVYSEDLKHDLYDILSEWFLPQQERKNLEVLINNFCDLVIRALKHVKEHAPPDRENDFPWQSKCVQKRLPPKLVSSALHILEESQCDFSSEKLPTNSVLDVILQGQKREKYGTDWIYHMYKQEKQVADYQYIPHILLQEQDPVVSDIHNYLVATMFKDCSVMIAYQRTEEPAEQLPKNHILTDNNKRQYFFNVGITDLDPKPWSCVDKHWRRDTAALEACSILRTEKRL